MDAAPKKQMGLTELFIRRPIFATVLNLVLILLGVVAFNQLTLREYPAIDRPVVNVDVDYRGASAEIMESQVTQPIEDALSGIEGIDFIASESRTERSSITVQFNLDRDMDAAASDVRDRVSRARKQLPDEAEEPIVSKVESDAQPIIYLAFRSDRMTPLEVTDYADRVVKDQLETLPGVASVNIFGARRYAMRVWLDRDRLAGYKLTPTDIENAIRAQNAEIPAGRIEGLDREFTVLAETDLKTPAEFDKIIVKEVDGVPVYLGQVARVVEAAEDERSIARYNGEPAIAMGIVRQSTANPLDLSKALQEKLPKIEAALPEGMKLSTAYDTTVFINKSIQAVFITIFEAILLVVLVIFLFLRSFRAMLVPVVAIPVCLVASFALMSLFGFSLNTLTLLALVIAIGLVVDDAIVMLENITRYIEAGEDPFTAALKGAKEITFAVIAMTLTLAAVFAPVAFSTGITGKIFTEFALTLAGAVIISGFVALTLTPTMCARVLSHAHTSGRFYEWIERRLNGITERYRRRLAWALNHRKIIVGIMLLSVMATGFMFTQLPRELAPYEDRNLIFSIAIGPEGATPEFMDRYIKQVEDVFRSIPERERMFTIIGFPSVTTSFAVLGLKPWDERDRVVFEIMGELFGKFSVIPGAMVFPNLPPSLQGGGRSRPLEVVLRTTGSMQDLTDVMSKVVAAAAASPLFLQPDTDLKLNSPELRVKVNRDKLAQVGLTPDVVGRALESMLGGRQVTRYKKSGEQYDVIVQVEDSLRTDPADITRVFVRVPSGEMVALSNFVTVENSVAPKELIRFNKLRAATFESNLAPGVGLDQAIRFVEKTVEEIGNPTIQLDYKGNSREFQAAGTTILFLFGLALLFIYLVLAAQFESWRDPLIIMFSVPTAIFGAVLIVYIANLAIGMALNIYSQIGLIALIGLITKHGILIVEFTNQKIDAGEQRLEALLDASVQRLRPILMTTAAMVLGSLPLALASGAGAMAQMSIGWVIVAGLTIGTVFTLFVVPVMYSYISVHAPEGAAPPAPRSKPVPPAPPVTPPPPPTPSAPPAPETPRVVLQNEPQIPRAFRPSDTPRPKYPWET
ncbi:MAG: efflux RND transporter permease subunit [Bdellovibrionales bacterium]